VWRWSLTQPSPVTSRDCPRCNPEAARQAAEASRQALASAVRSMLLPRPRVVGEEADRS
jgi:hypothetical protein